MFSFETVFLFSFGEGGYLRLHRFVVFIDFHINFIFELILMLGELSLNSVQNGFYFLFNWVWRGLSFEC